jgi:hypothetical protein
MADLRRNLLIQKESRETGFPRVNEFYRESVQIAIIFASHAASTL